MKKVAKNTKQNTLHSDFLWDRLKTHPDYAHLCQDPCSFAEGVLGLRSPLNLPSIEFAIHYIKRALETLQDILILGDKDVDGVSSTALLGSFLKERHHGSLELIVSDKGDDYGLSGDIFQRLRSVKKGTLVILLDMGTSHGPEIEILVKNGNSVIVLDHHMLHDYIPNPALCAFVNPQRNIKEHAPNHGGHGGKIATVGLVFKFLFALALSYTRDWRRVYVMEAKKKCYAFVCGHCVGSFTLYEKEEWFSFFQKKHAKKNLFDDTQQNQDWEIVFLCEMEKGKEGTDNSQKEKTRYLFSSDEWAMAQNDIDYAGRLLLAKTVETRPRLYNFVRMQADLAALGTVTDMVPLLDENRALVRIGIGRAAYGQGRQPGMRSYRTGYMALVEALGLNQKSILSRDLSWSLGPSINAAGRMGNTRLALDLLISLEKEEAKRLARKLVRVNESRKRRTKRNEKIIQDHLTKVPEKIKQAILFCYHSDLEPGVSGILATRLTEQYKKPVIYINNDGAYARGSARTWNGFNVLNLLDTASHLFIQFGGHIEASGFSIAYENIPLLEKQLLTGYDAIMNGKGKEQSLLKPSGIRDYHIELDIGDLTPRRFRELQYLEPFGPSNPEPIIRLSKIEPIQPYYMREGLHASFRVKGPSFHKGISFLAWRQGEQIQKAISEKQFLNLYGCMEMSPFRGNYELHFRVDAVELAHVESKVEIF